MLIEHLRLQYMAQYTYETYLSGRPNIFGVPTSGIEAGDVARLGALTEREKAGPSGTDGSGSGLEVGV